MKTKPAIRLLGMQTSIGSLGLVEAERFLTALPRDCFHCTKWGWHGLLPINLTELARTANCCSNKV